MSHTGPVHTESAAGYVNALARRACQRRGRSKFPGLLQEIIDRKRGDGYHPLMPLGTQYRRIKFSDGALYIMRPDGWRFAGYKA